MTNAALTDQKRLILEGGSALLTGYTNVARGTLGAAVHELHEAGLMDKAHEPSPDDFWITRYVTNSAGRAALSPKS